MGFSNESMQPIQLYYYLSHSHTYSTILLFCFIWNACTAFICRFSKDEMKRNSLNNGKRTQNNIKESKRKAFGNFGKHFHGKKQHFIWDIMFTTHYTVNIVWCYITVQCTLYNSLTFTNSTGFVCRYLLLITWLYSIWLN